MTTYLTVKEFEKRLKDARTVLDKQARKLRLASNSSMPLGKRVTVALEATTRGRPGLGGLGGEVEHAIGKLRDYVEQTPNG